MTSSLFAGKIWQRQALNPEVVELLQQRDRLLVFENALQPSRLTIGVPHHAWRGSEHIALNWINPRTNQPGRAADEMAGLNGLALLAACQEHAVGARLVIAAHPSDHDPNKTPGSPYWQAIFAPPLPDLLFEVHAIGARRRHDLELSAGSNPHAQPLEFGRRLAELLPEQVALAAQRQPGADDAQVFQQGQARAARLQTPALNTHSLRQAGVLGFAALHLELKPAFRDPLIAQPGEVQPNPLAWQLARALAQVIAEQFVG